MRLLSQDLWGISKSISDAISRPDILVDNYLDTYAEKVLVNSFNHFKDMDEQQRKSYKKDWDHTTHYIGADQGIQNLIEELPEIKLGSQICGMIQPFRPKGAVRRTCNALRGIDSNTYVGLADSGSMCGHAAGFTSYFARPLKSESY